MRDFRILGPLEVVVDDRPVGLGGPKQRAALAILLLNANRVVSVERFADALYAGQPPVTAVTQVQRQISGLRRLLGADTIETRAPGYVLRADPEHLDLGRFERFTEDAAHALERNEREAAVDLIRRSLELWRGPPLADLTYESFAQPAIARLEELRLTAVEQRLEAELELGHHERVLPELETIVPEHPLRERPRALLMLALYRAGRQPEALEVYRSTRDSLVGEYGIEPSAALRELERRILTQDPGLDLSTAAPSAQATEGERTLLVVAREEERLDALLSIAAPLAAMPGRALIVARLLADEREVTAAAAALSARRGSLGASARAAAFTSDEPARDVVRLATNYDVELVLMDRPGEPSELAAVAEHSPADLAVLSGAAVEWTSGAGIFVPFGGAPHDWAALELAAWLASAAEAPLKVVGTAADPSRGRRDASRLLADASLAVQRVVGVAAEPLLVDPTGDALRAAVEPATVVVTGFPPRWPAEDVGLSRAALVSGGPAALLVYGGTRPGGLAPRETRTRFSWSLEP